MDRINRAYSMDNSGVAQAASVSGSPLTEKLRAQTRQSASTGNGSAGAQNVYKQTVALADKAEISDNAWMRYLVGEEAVPEGASVQPANQSYAGLRNDKKSASEVVLWQRADQDRSYLADQLAGKQSVQQSPDGQEDRTLERMLTLLYFSGSRTQRVAFAHYKPDYTRAETAYQPYSQHAPDTGQPAFYQTGV